MLLARPGVRCFYESLSFSVLKRYCSAHSISTECDRPGSSLDDHSSSANKGRDDTSGEKNLFAAKQCTEKPVTTLNTVTEEQSLATKESSSFTQPIVDQSMKVFAENEESSEPEDLQNVDVAPQSKESESDKNVSLPALGEKKTRFYQPVLTARQIKNIESVVALDLQSLRSISWAKVNRNLEVEEWECIELFPARQIYRYDHVLLHTVGQHYSALVSIRPDQPCYNVAVVWFLTNSTGHCKRRTRQGDRKCRGDIQIDLWPSSEQNLLIQSAVSKIPKGCIYIVRDPGPYPMRNNQTSSHILNLKMMISAFLTMLKLKVNTGESVPPVHIVHMQRMPDLYQQMIGYGGKNKSYRSSRLILDKLLRKSDASDTFQLVMPFLMKTQFLYENNFLKQESKWEQLACTLLLANSFYKLVLQKEVK